MNRCWLALSLCIVTSTALAHDPSRSLLTLTAEASALTGRLDVSLRDLEEAVGLDANGDFAISWGELQARQAEVRRYVLEHVRVAADGTACTLDARQDTVDTHGGASYAVVDLTGTCAAAPQQLRVDYALLFDRDPTHRSLLQISNRDGTATAVLSAEHPSFELTLGAPNAWSSFARFVQEGVWHIWHGYDHLAFLALLVLPVVFGRGKRAPTASRARDTLWQLARIVTAFTVAHSITLGLAVFGVIQVPARGVEVVIALSVLIAAALNLLPRTASLGWRLAFTFGLVHGLGFANAMSSLGADRGSLLGSLGGFNVGVELGQLAVVAIALPILFALRRLPKWRGFVMPLSSAACAGLAVMWLVERV